MRLCDECGDALEDDWDYDLCEECMNNFASGIFHTDDIWPNEEDL